MTKSFSMQHGFRVFDAMQIFYRDHISTWDA
jgi:hypothetical protein